MASARLQADIDPLEQADALIAQGRPAEAADRLHRLLEAGRGGLLTRLAYARAVLAAGENERALEVARETAHLFPGVAAAAAGLGEALLRAGRLPTAIGELQRALRIDPESGAARYLLGCAWLEAGEAEKALQEFASISPKDAPADFAAKTEEAESMQAAPRASARYVRHLFDQFSGEYDSRMLEQLHYAAPRILRELFRLVSPPVALHSLAILDLGCGTGLSGLAFEDLAHRLDGVDLSPEMVRRAGEREIYSRVLCGDIENAEAEAGIYDLVVAADTLVYLGDLSRVFGLAHCALKSEGLFLFTVEKSGGAPFELGPKRRWRHSERYLRSEAAHARFSVAGLLACSPRTEAGEPVDGLAAALRKHGKGIF